MVSPDPDEDEGVANDSDTSPPQSRGRGRFEKGRAKVGSRGQSEDARSTSSQAADEESSSHVRQSVRSCLHICLSHHFLSERGRSVCVAAGPVASEDQPWRRRPALRLLPRRRRGERDQGDAAQRQLQKSSCTLQVHGKTAECVGRTVASTPMTI